MQVWLYGKKGGLHWPKCEKISSDNINKNHLNTTIGQLNFFRWVLNNKIIDYIELYKLINKPVNKPFFEDLYNIEKTLKLCGLEKLVK